MYDIPYGGYQAVNRTLYRNLLLISSLECTIAIDRERTIVLRGASEIKHRL